MSEKQQLPWWQKYTLTLNEVSEYFGIGYKKLKQFVTEHKDDDFVLWNGNRAQIEYSPAAEPPVRCGESHHSGLTEPPVMFNYCI